MKTMLDALYTKITEVEGLPISYGYIANKICYITYDHSNIEVYPTEEKALAAFRKLLRHKLMEYRNPEETDLPY